MNFPIILHGSNPEETFAFGKAVSDRFGISLIRLGKNEEKEFDRDFSGQNGGVWCVPSAFVIDRARRIRCISEGILVRIGASEGWSVRENHDVLADEASNGRVNELIESELNEAHLVVVPKVNGFEKSVEEIFRVVKRRPVAVAAGEQSYLVEVGREITEKAILDRNWGSATALYITDENVKRIHGEKLKGIVDKTGMRIEEKVLEPGEESKCLKTLGNLFEKALESGIDRSSWVIAAGGGVVTDIGGLVAAMWMRGIKWVGIPTTLLSMVDASVGGKTAIDFGLGKNAVGAFWQPSSVVCDVEWLLTETERNYVGALSEVVKTAMIGDVGLFRLLEEEADKVVARDLDLMAEVVRRCVQVKARVVGIDPRESGIRALLNFGHTVGHALEALGEYKKYTHGEAVSIGMVAALKLGRRAGHTSADVQERTIRLLRKVGLPVDLPIDELEKASELLGHDKKRAGSSIRFVYAYDIGDVRAERVVLEDLREAVVGLAAR